MELIITIIRRAVIGTAGILLLLVVVGATYLESTLPSAEMINDMKFCSLSEEFIYSKQKYMIDLLKEFRYKYISVNHYLDSVGFNHLDQNLFINSPPT